ncbi:MAG: hypothetical protein QM669_04950 [Siphonobacter sp.]
MKSLRIASFLLIAMTLLHIQSFGMGTPHRLYSGKSIVSKLVQKTGKLVHHQARQTSVHPIEEQTEPAEYSFTHSIVTFFLKWTFELFGSHEEVVRIKMNHPAATAPAAAKA